MTSTSPDKIPQSSESTSTDLSIVSTDNSASPTEEAINRAVFYVWQGHPLKASDKKWLGTAFAIGSHQCLTANHVINGADTDNLYLHGQGLKTPQKISTCKPHESRDVCLLTVDKGAPAFSDKLTLNTAPFEDYQHSRQVLHAYGYVKLDEELRHAETKVSTYNGEVSAWALKGIVGKGHSGGCLLNNDKEVIGVISSTNPDKNDFYTIAVDSFRAWLTDFVNFVPSQKITAADATIINTIISAYEHNQAIDKEDKNAIHTVSIPPLHRYLLKRLTKSAKNKKLSTQFIQLSVFTDEGKNNKQGQFQSDKKTYQDLTELLHHHQGTALVLVGRPGNGKTTLLEHLELQLAYSALSKHYPTTKTADNEKIQALGIPFYVELSKFPSKDDPNIEPFTWLEQQWQKSVATELTFADALREQQVLLLLDALNEMAIPNRELENRIRQWQAFLINLDQEFPMARALFSCRTIDYSTVLSDERKLPVPQIRFNDITPDIITDYFTKELGKIDGEALAKTLIETQGLEITTPFYLHLAANYWRETRKPPNGPSELIASMIWLSMIEEYKKFGRTEFIEADEFLTPREQTKLGKNNWTTNPHDLPKRGLLINALIQLAYTMQIEAGGSKEIRRSEDEIIDFFMPHTDNNENKAVALKNLTEQLDFLVTNESDTSAKFSHQLLQEYLAAHQFVHEQNLSFLNKPWQQDKALPNINDTLKALGVAEPLPPRQPSGWEESVCHAAAIATNPIDFIRHVEPYDCVSAAKAAFQHEVAIKVNNEHQAEFKQLQQQLKQNLLTLSQNPKADLRARIEAGLMLGTIGDPRFSESISKNNTRYIEPPMATVLAGTYTIGSENGEEDEKPVHTVTLEEFCIGQYPVTNAEWRCFMEDGGYENPKWWITENAQRWREGTLERSEEIDWHLNRYRELVQDFNGTCAKYRVTIVGQEHYKESLETFPTEEMLEKEIRSELKPLVYTEPSEWNNVHFCRPNQPVVGICWYEALAYCQWLSAVTGKTYQLPTEAHWKAAAGGKHHNTYPWGENSLISLQTPLANTLELHLRATNPVGLLAEGATPTSSDTPAIYDLAGNCWEWSQSNYESYHVKPESNHYKPNLKVLNGCDWASSLYEARTTYRNNSLPNYRNSDVGFRLLCCPP